MGGLGFEYAGCGLVCLVAGVGCGECGVVGETREECIDGLDVNVGEMDVLLLVHRRDWAHNGLIHFEYALVLVPEEAGLGSCGRLRVRAQRDE